MREQYACQINPGVPGHGVSGAGSLIRGYAMYKGIIRDGVANEILVSIGKEIQTVYLESLLIIIRSNSRSPEPLKRVMLFGCSTVDVRVTTQRQHRFDSYMSLGHHSQFPKLISTFRFPVDPYTHADPGARE
jgi:hypothetical protein